MGGLLAVAVALPAEATVGARDRSTIPFGEEPITPVPRAVALDADKVRLGEALFHDARLSRGDVLACASCHRLDEGGDDNRARAPGADGELLDFNAPTVFNAALSFRLNWRGNFRSLEEQIEAVLLDRSLMNTTWQELLPKLRADAAYREAFAAAYGSGPAPAYVLDALATFERSLLTPDARFDRYLRGERAALEPEERRGYELFKAYRCAACHQGVNVGGNLFQKFGIFYDPFAQPNAVSEADLGRLAVTGKEADRHVFRVPSLRNVAITAPYFHDGSTASLEEAVDTMGRSQLGRPLTAQDIDLIVAFLRTLTGEYRGRPLAPDPGLAP
jgi:cytochrome c peroxidase